MILHAALAAVALAAPESNLYRAACRGDIDTVRALAEGAPRRVVDEYVETPGPTMTPLLCALESGHVEVVRVLLQAKANPNFHDGTQPPLELALGTKLSEEEDRGADPNAEGSSGTPLLAYLGSGTADLATLELLAARGAKLDAGGPECDAYCETARTGDLAAFRWLLGKKLPIAPRCGRVLSVVGSTDVADLAVSSGCKVDPEGPALLDQAERGSAMMVRWLLAHGARLDPRTPGAPTPLMRAVERGHAEVVQALLEAGADPARKNAAGESALSIGQRRAEAKGYADEVDEVLRRSVEVKRLQGEPVEVILMGGGEQPADAEAALARFKAEAKVVETIAPLAEGFPAIRKSDEIEGLRPGFHVVLLGFCPKNDVAARLALFRPLFPGTYSRSVKVKLDGPACPQALGEVLDKAEVALPDGSRLRLVLLSAEPRTFARLEHAAKGGAILAAKTVDVTATDAVPPSQASCSYQLDPGKGVIRFAWSCSGVFESMCRHTDTETRWRFGVGAPGTFAVDEKRSGGAVIECAE